ncbi:MAG: hypothetical protein EOO28_00260 [Comamonadaceae bacterium]|nr:MAG: hypothetical protein EOO28_00260 [Comamonadaceae bacterium]
MKKLAILLLPAILLGGCAAELISADADKVVVRAQKKNAAEAQDVAEAECQKRGMHARLTGRPSDDRLVFDCVR